MYYEESTTVIINLTRAKRQINGREFRDACKVANSVSFWESRRVMSYAGVTQYNARESRLSRGDVM